MKIKNSLIVILGPTASGKSALGVQFAKRFHGEIVSADSRQVYKGLEIGSGQISKREMAGIPHHCLSIASPKTRFTVSRYKKEALKAINQIHKKGKLPILVGGTPFYIYSVVDGWDIPEVKPNHLLRRKLETFSVARLHQKLKKLDPLRASTIETKNKRRLIRALEIILSTGKPVPKLAKRPLPYPIFFIGIKKSPRQLKIAIKKRFLGMLRQGFLTEVKNLKKSGLSWHHIESFGLEYREAAQYAQGKVSKTQMIEHAIKATEDFSRRQMTWFKKDARIHWFGSAGSALAFLARRGIVYPVRSKMFL